ncbi:MAG: flagellar protein FliT [Porticoccaceae bacterium]|jgi:flagellar protein FliT
MGVAGDIDSMSPQHFLASYETLLGLSSRMLGLAYEGEWEALIEEEGNYLMAMDHLARLDTPPGITPAQQEYQLSLMEQILEQSVEIQRHLLTRREELGRMIAMSERKRDVDRAYLGQGDGVFNKTHSDR